MDMRRQYFGSDGIRGRAGYFPITPDFALHLAHVVGRMLHRSEECPTVLIGKDTRISGHMLESALVSGFNSAGVNVMLAGTLPTPGVAYLTRALRASLGVVISASHNTFEDNGIKFFSAKGTKLPYVWEVAVEQMLLDEPHWVSAIALGKTQVLDDAAGRYIEFCKSTCDHAFTLRGLKIVVDAGHGAAYQIAPMVFHELGAEVVAIGCAPNGLNINQGAGAAHPELLATTVSGCGADFGIALDGDADRLLVVDAAGRLYNGDELLYLVVADRLEHEESIAGAVGTLMTNMAVEQAFELLDVDFMRTKVGDRYVLEELSRRGWTFGGEGSGHLLILDRHSTGDGLVNALQILQACVRTGRTLSQWLLPVQLYPQALLNVHLPPERDWHSNALLTRVQAQVEAELGSTGRVLVRHSGTEPVLHVMVEAQDGDQASRCAERLVSAARDG